MERLQGYGVANNILQQATGRKDIATTDDASFVQVFNTALKSGYDPVAKAVSAVVGRTIFSSRAYGGQFNSLKVDPATWGAITRKENAIDRDFRDDPSWALKDGDKLNEHTVSIPKTVETVITNSTVDAIDYTVLSASKLMPSFSGVADFNAWLQMIAQNVHNEIVQKNESVARATVANLIVGIKVSRPATVRHLLTEYNAATGNTYTATTVRAADVYPDYCRWKIAQINTASKMLENRSHLYSTQLDGKPIARHTPLANQKLFVMTSDMEEIKARVMNDFIKDFAKLNSYEEVNYWQSPKNPAEIQAVAKYLQTDGTTANTEETTVSNISALLIDEEAAGYCIRPERAGATPYDVEKDAFNLFYAFDRQYWNDFTENAVLFLDD